ncbi:hypothetical protein BpOF4_09925 [Alkalihalophilus pseudofirmus OF4]|uniref:DUF4368 domain-containing protein n=1 Tax=Alkalihalophilus pseudofirmus (strain ATCC BAA-2126 / JCM 17055 / OF4) TaxID=398511 RepID=D3FTG7_ALKPO|nr:hypothetical protein [Alkalihalophilus pseudofirmus]ADC50040.1 hypothetical protein BpOF4_09925 [Alkalihalophilus pseudofirmus OF4]
MSDEAELKLKELSRQQLELNDTLQEDPLNNALAQLKEVLAQLEPFEEVTHQMLQYLVERIEISEKGEPSVIYRFSLLNEV